MALGFTRGGSGDETTDYDPLFYRGKTPVLGAPVELKTSGTLPGEFPQAGPGPAPTAPTAPTGPTMPAFPDFNFQFPEFGFPPPPTFPGAPNVDILGPAAMRTPWWSGVLQGVETAGNAQAQAKRLARLTQQSPSSPSQWGGDQGQFSLFGGESTPWWGASGEPTFTLTGPEGAPTLDPAAYRILGNSRIYPGVTEAGVPETVPSGSSGGLGGVFQAAGPALQSAGGLYAAITAPGGSPGQLAGAANAAGGLAALGSQLGLLGADYAALGPVGALVSLPAIVGPLIRSLTAKDEARWPKGYSYIPGTGGRHAGSGAMAIDPSTGAMLVYKGGGHYAWADPTLQGQLPTPEQLTQWEITPTGALAERPGYETIGRQLRDLRMSPDRATLAPGSGGATPEDIRSALEERRQPTIEQIAAAHPGASQGELWRQYTLTPEYQQERTLEYQRQYPDR